MKIAFLLLFLSLSIMLNAQVSQINFRDFSSFEEIKAAGKKENKDIMLYFHYKGCAWCRLMEKTTFTDSAVGEYYNNAFINVSIDFLKDSVGKNLRKKLMVPGAPSYVFMNSDGEVKHNELGYKLAEDFLKVGQIACDPNSNYRFYAEKFANNDHSVNTIFHILSNGSRLDYADSLVNLMIEANKDKPEELFGETGFKLIYEFGCWEDSPLFKFLFDNYENFLKYSGRDIVDYYIKEFWAYRINRVWIIFFHPERSREKAKKRFAELGLPNYDQICTYADYSDAKDFYVRVKKKRKKWFIRYIAMADKYFAIYHNDWRAYSEAALAILDTDFRLENQEYIARAKKWAEMAIEIKECPKSLYTYACLLKELNKDDEATEIMNKLIKLSRKVISYQNYKYRDLATKMLNKWKKS